MMKLSCVTLTACFLKKMVDANSDGGTLLGIMTEQACAQQCLDRYPECKAVDYRTNDQSCYWHNVISGTQWNSCCNRYQITCTRTLSFTSSSSSLSSRASSLPERSRLYNREVRYSSPILVTGPGADLGAQAVSPLVIYVPPFENLLFTKQTW